MGEEDKSGKPYVRGIEERLIKKYGKLTSDKMVVTFSGSKIYIDSRKQR